MSDAKPLEGVRLLIAEDEYFIASDLQRELRFEGASVIGPFASLAQAMAIGAAENIDCAILDINLNGVPSFPLADRLTERNVPFMFLTGYDGWSIPEGYRDIPRIAKPYSAASVLQTVRQLLPLGGLDAERQPPAKAPSGPDTA